MRDISALYSSYRIHKSSKNFRCLRRLIDDYIENNFKDGNHGNIQSNSCYDTSFIVNKESYERIMGLSKNDSL